MYLDFPTQPHGQRTGISRSLALLAILLLAGCGGGGSSGGTTTTTTGTTTTTVTVPGAPTIGAGTAGNASASIAFTAPASTGGATITAYTGTCTASGISKTGTTTASPVSVTGLTNGTAYSCSVTATNSAGTSAASAAVTVTPVASSGSSYSTASVNCPYSQSTLNTTINLTSTSSWSCTSTLRTLAANGLPNHTTGTFPNSGNPNTISAQTVSFSTTVSPAIVSTTGTSVAHITGYANNGVKFDPATAQTCTTNCANNGQDSSGTWSIEALGQTYFAFGNDTNNAHVQPNGAYHYHGVPVGLLTLDGNTGQKMTLAGYAVDGFPIYVRYGYTTATSATSAIKTLTSSYRLKTTLSTGRPSTTIAAAGTFTQDYEYVAGLGDLDECNGRTGVTPEFPGGIYYYVVTDTFPYIQRCVKGTASSTTG